MRSPSVDMAPDSPDAGLACPRTRGIRAVLLTLAAGTAAAPPLASFARLVPWPWALVALVSLGLALGGLRHRPGEHRLRGVATGALWIWTLGVLAQAPDAPGAGLAMMLAAVTVTAWLWPTERLRLEGMAQSDPDVRPDLALAAAVAVFFGLEHTFGFAFAATPASSVDAVLASTAMTAAFLVPLLLARDHGRMGRVDRVAEVAAFGAAALPLLDALLGLAGLRINLAPFGLLAPGLLLARLALTRRGRRRAEPTGPAEPSLIDTVLAHPSRVMVLSFLLLCTAGGLLLGLPVASASEHALSGLDAAFTAVSATCVTGLAVVDTPTAFGGLGQAVVLVLIQVGGLGIMVFSAAAVVLLGRRLSLSHERAAVDLVGASGRADLAPALRAILIVTIATELLGAVLLFFGFMARGDAMGTAAWRGLFTAVSAFCNAGFALQSDSLVGYANSPFILGVVGAIIVIGSLGPGVIAAVLTWRRPASRTLHARLVLWTTLLLLAAPALLITVLEWNNTLAGMSLGEKLANGMFQSVTLRTAGFNSIDLAAVHPATWTVMVLTMFVGGSPGSTAGGAKTTTIAVALLAVTAVVRGRDRVEIFGRAVPMVTVLRAAAVTTLGVLSCCAGLIAVQLTQTLPLDVALFEVVSALATVGLSTGGTGQLDEVGKVIIMVCMFMGRVGPLTLFVFLTSQGERGAAVMYPDETVPIG
ncbi:MAG: hypothetical protein KC620_15335 [Myxococcales bacterium]|nr:hypothetical protein [Myxococcales bacterium]